MDLELYFAYICQRFRLFGLHVLSMVSSIRLTCIYQWLRLFDLHVFFNGFVYSTCSYTDSQLMFSYEYAVLSAWHHAQVHYHSFSLGFDLFIEV